MELEAKSADARLEIVAGRHLRRFRVYILSTAGALTSIFAVKKVRVFVFPFISFYFFLLSSEVSTAVAARKGVPVTKHP
jgi:hypothetical protein